MKEGLIVGGIVGIFLFILVMYSSWDTQNRMNKPCQEYANWQYSGIPARCVKEFNK
jgi:hypothetical protein